MTELLAGLRVLDLSLWQPGHTATQLLADLGADVLKIEPPGGDRMRPIPDRFLNFNSHKRSLVLDLKLEADRARLHQLVAQAEVVVEGFKPGVADRLGAGYAQLRAVNPALVYCSISGFGQTGPLAQTGGHEQNYQAYAGVMSRPPNGAAPMPAAALMGDQGGGLAAAFGILAAVLCARRTGQGEHVDVSVADLMISWSAPMESIEEGAARKQRPPGMGVYPAAGGGHVALGVFSEDHAWDLLCRKLGLEQFVGLKIADRRGRFAEIQPLLQACFATRSREDWVADLGSAGVPIAPVLALDEAMELPHFWKRGVIARGPDGERRIAHPIRYVEHPSRPPGLAPALGEGGEAGFDKARPERPS